MIKIEYLIIGLVNGLILFLCSIKAYTLGLSHGKQLTNTNIPTVNLNPIKAYKERVEAKEEKKEADLVTEGLQNIFTYTGEVQKGGE